ncbi:MULTISPECIES: general stress protein [unclassified Microbacterium]|uniref:general stress protein n=1 Tax=unclassified Microbacterium TaxID=2609290 RepID=UPI0037475912
MSMLGGRVPAGRENVGETVASYPTYEAAQKAVSALIAAEVPARDIAIVGQDLRSIERVTGRLGYATAARSGAVNGLLLGLLFSFIFVLGTPTVQIGAFIGVMLIGVAFGMLLSLITYSIVRRRRDFASVMQVAAGRYEVCVDAASIQKARQVSGASAVAASPASAPFTPSPPPVPAPSDEEPPRYGERIPPSAPEAAPAPQNPEPPRA